MSYFEIRKMEVRIPISMNDRFYLKVYENVIPFIDLKQMSSIFLPKTIDINKGLSIYYMQTFPGYVAYMLKKRATTYYKIKFKAGAKKRRHILNIRSFISNSLQEVS